MSAAPIRDARSCSPVQRMMVIKARPGRRAETPLILAVYPPDLSAADAAALFDALLGGNVAAPARAPR